MTATAERHQFQAETKQLLDLMIHAIYSNKDIFLRELISNASDAIDKRKFAALTDAAAAVSEPHILLTPDKDARTLTLSDTGIGMNREDVVTLIGTIAKSGTKEFMTALKGQDGPIAPELIGQFGVGFYSTFIVADKVTLVTRRAGEDVATQWESTGDGTYTIEDTTRDEPGTTITLHLKPTDIEDGMRDYTDDWTIRDIVKKYSDFVAFPIQMDVTRTERDYDDEHKPVEGSERQVTERETLNSMKAIWTRPESEVTEDEYNEFYKHISHDWNDPLKTIRLSIEGTFEAKALLFLPGKAPMDLFHRDGKRGVQLYVKRVFIMDDCSALMPDYLRFVKGVVDAEDLSLNISREILQQDRQIQAIRKRLVKKVLSTLEDMRKSDKENFLTFWAEFGRPLKEGIYEDQDNRETLLDLAFFASTHDDTELTTLREYVDRMQSGQDKIYFITGESRQSASQSPHLEAFRAKGIEVLLFSDPVDEVWTQSVHEFDGKRLQSVGKGDVALGSEDEQKAADEAREVKEKEYGDLLGKLKDALSENVKEVRLSNRLTESASCLVGGQNDMTPQMEQLLRAMNQEVPHTKRVLELNPTHPLMAKLQSLFTANAEDPALGDYANLLYGQALLAEGSPLPEPARFSRLVGDLMAKSIG